MESSNSGSSFHFNNEFKFIMKDSEDDSSSELCKQDVEYMEVPDYMIEVEIVTAAGDDTMQLLVEPSFTSLTTSHNLLQLPDARLQSSYTLHQSRDTPLQHAGTLFLSPYKLTPSPNILVQPSNTLLQSTATLVQPTYLLPMPSDKSLDPSDILPQHSDMSLQQPDILPQHVDTLLHPSDKLLQSAATLLQPAYLLPMSSDNPLIPSDILPQQLDMSLQQPDILPQPVDTLLHTTVKLLQPPLIPMSSDKPVNTSDILPQQSDMLLQQPDILPQPVDTLLQPSTSTSADRFNVVDGVYEQLETAVIKRQSTRGQSCYRGYRRRGRKRGRVASKDPANSCTTPQQGHQVNELYATDEDIPPTLREIIRDLEVSRNGKTVPQLSKRRIVKKGKHDDKSNDVLCKKKFIADALFDGDSSAIDFQWSPMYSFEGKQEVFQPSDPPGPRRPMSCGYEAFRLFWDDDILEHIVIETNRYALSFSSQYKWVNTNKHEILVLFAFWIMLGIIQMPTIHSCFTKNHLLETNIFRKLLTQERYQLLNRALHFVDNTTHTLDSSKLFCLGPVIDHLNKKFKEAYTLSQNIVIDESLLSWKGLLSFKQRIKSKSGRDGIKIYELCESDTGYLWSFMIYSGKDPTTSSKLPKNIEIVHQLIKPILNKGHRLFLDNWFNSPVLARFLKRNNTDCIGTLRKTCKNIPHLIKLATIPEGMCVARHSGDVVVMAYQNKRTVFTISTCHGTNSVPVVNKSFGSIRFKPEVIADYNKSMGGVDRMDQLLEPYLIERRRCSKWYKKLFKRFLNISILNSNILVDKSTKNKQQKLEFRLKLVEKIMENHLDHISPTYFPRISTPRIRSHFVTRNVDGNGEAKPSGSRIQTSRRNCVLCKKIKKHRKTSWKCEQCNVPLCLKSCFKAFHTK